MMRTSTIKPLQAGIASSVISIIMCFCFFTYRDNSSSENTSKEFARIIELEKQQLDLCKPRWDALPESLQAAVALGDRRGNTTVAKTTKRWDSLPESLRAAVALGDRRDNGPSAKSSTTSGKWPPPPAVALLATEKEQRAVAEKLKWLFQKRPLDYKCATTKTVTNYYNVDSWTYCADKTFMPKPPCLIYSIGVNWDFAFEDAMEKLGCDVLSYDPSMDNVAHRHSPRTYFQPVGLGAEDNDAFLWEDKNYMTNANRWKMRTLRSLVEENDHRGRTIDLLKFDVETSEWNITQNLIDSGILSQVKQLLLEWHIFPHFPPRSHYARLQHAMEGMTAAGMDTFYQLPHGCKVGNWKTFNLQADVGYVNRKFY